MALETRTPTIARFGTFAVDLRAGELSKQGKRVKLQDQPFQVLAVLLQRPGDVVTREELRSQIWPGDTFVDFDNSLNTAVNKLREALGDSADNPRFIETLPRRGYRFIAATVPDAIQPKTAKSPLRRFGLALGAAAIFLVVALVSTLDPGGLRSRLSTRFAAQPQIRSLAVLPLANLSGDPNQEYFADAMTEQLISELSRIGSLKVISRTSIMRYKGQNKSLSEIGRELNVDAVMEGAVVCSGNRVRIAAQLIYAPTDHHLMAETYEGELRDALKLQREVAEAITQRVKLKLTAGEEARLRNAPEVNPEAYQAYLGATKLDFGLYPENEKARSYLEKAIQEDPGFAEAYGALAVAYSVLGEQRLRSPQDAYPRAKQAIRKALELDDKNCRFHSILYQISWRYDWDWQTADRELLYSLEMCPNSVVAHSDRALYMAWNGRAADALAEIAKCRELDPLQSEPLHGQAEIYYQLRNYKLLTEVSRSLKAFWSNDWLAYYWMGVGYEGSGQTREALAEYQKAVELSQHDSDATAALAHAYATMGKRAEALKILDWERQSPASYVSPYMIATVYAGLGEKDKAFEYLEKSYQERSSDLPYFLKADLRIDSLRSDPRFQDLLRRMNFPH